ncbi:hypothetical protein ACI6Q2_19850 [Chitinophagaceae bacterium LWZ2-11]
MKILFIWLCCALTLSATAQTTVTRNYPIKAGDKLDLKFDYPKIVHISTWDKNEVSVVAHVSINNGENDTAFVLEDKTVDGVLTIKNRIKDMDKLPRTYTIVQDGKKTIFHSKEDYKAFSSNGGVKRYSSEGVDMEITIEVKVPANTTTNIKSTYGIVELVNFNAPINIDAPYGGIDATVVLANTGKLQATTNYGEIYTNLELKITDKTEKDFYTSFTAEPGKGPAYILKSTYGKIYLRK